MKKFSRIIAAVIAVAVCLCCTGCSAIIERLFEQFHEPQQSTSSTVEEVTDPYELDVFDSLPGTFADINPLFWEIEGEDGNKVYLLGSIHVADKSAYRLPEDIMDAFFESDSLAVECDTIAFTEDFARQLEYTYKYMMYSNGESIEDHLSEETIDGLIDLLEQYPEYLSEQMITVETLKHCKPAVWMSAIDNIFVGESKLDTDLGIDTHFLKLAKAMGKEVLEVESIEFQYNMMDEFSDELYELIFASYLQISAEDQVQSLLDLYEAWKDGTPEDELEPEDTDDESLTDEEIELIEGYNNAMVYDRNIGMADTVEDYLDSGKNVFFIVGAGHMTGEGGIIDLLTERGYDITQLGGGSSVTGAVHAA